MSEDQPSPERADLATEPSGRVPQFGLRGLLGLVALTAVLFAVAAAFGYTWGFVLAWFVLLVSVHVAANVWGARRRRAELLATTASSSDPPCSPPAGVNASSADLPQGEDRS